MLKNLLLLSKDYEQEIFELCILSQNERENGEWFLQRLLKKTQLIGKSHTNILAMKLLTTLACPWMMFF